MLITKALPMIPSSFET